MCKQTWAIVWGTSLPLGNLLVNTMGTDHSPVVMMGESVLRAHSRAPSVAAHGQTSSPGAGPRQQAARWGSSSLEQHPSPLQLDNGNDFIFVSLSSSSPTLLLSLSSFTNVNFRLCLSCSCFSALSFANRNEFLLDRQILEKHHTAVWNKHS